MTVDVILGLGVRGRGIVRAVRIYGSEWVSLGFIWDGRRVSGNFLTDSTASHNPNAHSIVRCTPESWSIGIRSA